MSLAALLWAAILLLAALPKLGGMPRSMLRAMRDLGLAAWLMRPGYAWLHLAAQIVLASGLIFAPAPTSWIFTIAGSSLAGIYLIIVWQQRGFVCRCLSETPHPITSVTVARNVFLLALALMSLGGQGVWGLSFGDWPAVIPLLGAVACEAVSRRQSAV